MFVRTETSIRWTEKYYVLSNKYHVIIHHPTTILYTGGIYVNNDSNDMKSEEYKFRTDSESVEIDSK